MNLAGEAQILVHSYNYRKSWQLTVVIKYKGVFVLKEVQSVVKAHVYREPRDTLKILSSGYKFQKLFQIMKFPICIFNLLLKGEKWFSKYMGFLCHSIEGVYIPV